MWDGGVPWVLTNACENLVPRDASASRTGEVSRSYPKQLRWSALKSSIEIRRMLGGRVAVPPPLQPDPKETTATTKSTRLRNQRVTELLHAVRPVEASIPSCIGRLSATMKR